MIILGILFTILQLSDIISTNIAIKAGCTEANPLLKETVDSKGFPLSMALVKISIGVILTVMTIISNLFLNILIIVLDITLLIVVINNITRIPIQRKYNRLYYMESATILKFTQLWDVRKWITSIRGLNKTMLENKWKKKAFKHVSIVREWIKKNSS
ncbi:MAG: DUF5658 family protein [Promethearchaeota archaeon]